MVLEPLLFIEIILAIDDFSSKSRFKWWIKNWNCGGALFDTYFGSQISVTLEVRPRKLGNYLACKTFAVQTIQWSMEFVIQKNLEHNTIAVWSLAQRWSISIKIETQSSAEVIQFDDSVLFYKWVDWFLYNRGLRRERGNKILVTSFFLFSIFRCILHSLTLI